MKLRTKLILGFGAIALVTGILGIFTLFSYFDVQEEVSVLQEDIIPGALSMLETDAAVKSLLVEVEQIVHGGGAAHPEHALEAIARIQENTAAHTAHGKHMGEEEGQAAQEMENRAASIISGAEQILETVEAGGAPAEVESLLLQIHTEAEDLEAIFEEHVAEHKSELAATEENVYQVLATGIRAIWVAFVIAVVLSLGVGYYFIRTFTGPVLTVTGVARKMAAGDINQTVEIRGRDEIGLMGNAFRQMIANLSHLIGQVQQSANQVTEASQQVATTIQQVAQGTNQQTLAVTEVTGNAEQLARAAEGIARGAQEQAQTVQNMSDLIQQMADIVDQVRAGTKSVTEGNIGVTQAARRGVTTVEQTGQGMETIRARTTAAAEKVKEMGSRSREIGRIVETIDDIADKTDMLALNAAVEAARAGEHGRGFAVVADQVRKLSEDSKGATRDIAQLIERVQETVNEAIAAMENSVAEVDNGTRLAKDTAQSLQDILQAAEEATSLAKQINEAVDNLKQKSEGVVASVGSVSAVVEENTAVAEEMAANSQEVTDAMEGVVSVAEENNAAAEEVSASAEELSALAEELYAATAQFTVGETGWTRQKSGNGAGVAGVPTNHQPPQATPALTGQQSNGHSNSVISIQ